MGKVRTVTRQTQDLNHAPDGNVQHIAEHDLSKEEVESVLLETGAVEGDESLEWSTDRLRVDVDWPVHCGRLRMEQREPACHLSDRSVRSGALRRSNYGQGSELNPNPTLATVWRDAQAQGKRIRWSLEGWLGAGFGGLTISLEGGLDDVDEFFLARASSASSFSRLAVSSAIFFLCSAHCGQPPGLESSMMRTSYRPTRNQPRATPGVVNGYQGVDRWLDRFLDVRQRREALGSRQEVLSAPRSGFFLRPDVTDAWQL